MGVINCFLLALASQDIPAFRILIHCSTLRGIELLEHGLDFDSDSSRSDREAKPELVALHNARAYARWRPHGQLDLKPTS